MELSIGHIDSPDLPFRKLVMLEKAGNIDPALKPILLEEIGLGNRICGAGGDEFMGSALAVSLSDPFHKRYDTPPGVTYVENPDCHYNYAQYATDGAPSHSVCAPFHRQ
jgi:hypothetical protein